MYNQYGVNEAEGAAMNKFPSNNTCFIGAATSCFDVEKSFDWIFDWSNGGIKGGVFVWRVCVESSNPNI